MVCIPALPRKALCGIAGTVTNFTLALENNDPQTEHAKSIQLVIVGATEACEVRQLVDSSGAVALRDSDFSLLVAR